MKKALLCLLLAVLLLTGCGAPGPTEEHLIRVGFSQVGSESDWRIANTASMLAALSEANGYELLFDNAKQRQENQLLAIRNFIQQDVDYIVLAPITESGWDDVLQEAKGSGIPVIIVDRRISVSDDSLYTSWVGSDFLAEGRRAVRWLEEQLQAQGRGQEPLRILHIQGTYGATAQLLRTRALTEALEAHPNWEIVAQLPGEYTEAKSYELMRDFLQTGQEIDVIYSENDNMTFGAIRALEEAGIPCGGEGEIMVLSFDAVRRALELCRDGKISLCVECNPLHGPRVAALLEQLENGSTPAKLTFVDELAFDRDMLTDEVIRDREY
jgi:simple sugar transport system substrate-binding protein